MSYGDAAMEKEPVETASNEEETPDVDEASDELERLKKEIEGLQEQVMEETAFSQNYLNSAKRVQADFDNCKKSQESLKKEIEGLQEQVMEETAFSQNYLNSAKRVQADFDNYKKRQQRELDRIVESANDGIISGLLTVIDDFERALSADDSDEFRKGVRQIHSNLRSLLRDHGLREVPTEGGFDPDLHEAICVEEGEDGEILEVYQKGYYLGERLIRYSKVKVGKKMEEDD